MGKACCCFAWWICATRVRKFYFHPHLSKTVRPEDHNVAITRADGDKLPATTTNKRRREEGIDTPRLIILYPFC